MKQPPPSCQRCSGRATRNTGWGALAQVRGGALGRGAGRRRISTLMNSCLPVMGRFVVNFVFFRVRSPLSEKPPPAAQISTRGGFWLEILLIVLLTSPWISCATPSPWGFYRETETLHAKPKHTIAVKVCIRASWLWRSDKFDQNMRTIF